MLNVVKHLRPLQLFELHVSRFIETRVSCCRPSQKLLEINVRLVVFNGHINAVGIVNVQFTLYTYEICERFLFLNQTTTAEQKHK